MVSGGAVVDGAIGAIVAAGEVGDGISCAAAVVFGGIVSDSIFPVQPALKSRRTKKPMMKRFRVIFFT